MKKYFVASALFSSLIVASGTMAQDIQVAPLPAPVSELKQPVMIEQRRPDAMVDAPSLSMTPEMWFYTQEQRRHDDPAQSVRRRAEFKAEQRDKRLATSKWFGYYNARPQANAVPIMGSYSPSWIGNGGHAYQWVGTNSTAARTVVLERTEIRR